MLIFGGATAILTATLTAVIVGAKAAKYDCSWDVLTSFPPATYQGIAMSRNGRVIAAVDGQSTFYISRDYGQTVSNSTIEGGIGVEVSGGGKYITIAAKQWIYSSEDFGATFTNQSIPNESYGVGMSSDGQYQLVSGKKNSTLIKSSDWGRTWVFGDERQDQNSGWASVIGLEGEYQIAGMGTKNSYLSDNFGKSFSLHDFGGFSEDSFSIYQIELSDSAKYQIMAGDGFMAVSNDSGASWTNRGRGDFYGAALNSNGEYQIAVEVDDSQRYFLSSDYGLTWYRGEGELPGNGDMTLSYARYVWDAKNVIISNWDESNGRIYMGSCGWTTTVTTEVVLAVVAEVLVEV